MVKDHKDDIWGFKSQASKGKDKDVESWASNHVSALQQHLTMARNLQKEYK
jgi:hypothetical protein